MSSRRGRTASCFPSVLALALLASPAVQAFCPTNGSRCGEGAAGKTHQDLTEETMAALGEEFFGISPPTGTMIQATEEVWKANAAVDDDQTNGFKHFDGESFATGKQRLVTLFDGVLSALRSEDASAARSQLGQALHTLQDFYSHSNWIESGRTGALPGLWRASESLPPAVAADQATCEACTLVLLADGSLVMDCGHNVLTPLLATGFYGGENEVPRVSTKCRHGGPFDTGPGPAGGINKDSTTQALSPHFFLHHPAADSARAASEQFIRDLAAQLTERQLRLLFGAGSTLAMAYDTSGGMDAGLSAQVLREAARLMDSRRGTPQEPSRYLLVPFSTSGARSCSASSLAAVQRVLASAGQGVDLFLLTRSSPGDEALASAVIALAQKKDARLHVLQSGACGGDAIHQRLAAETGGQFFRLQDSDALPVLHLIDATVRANALALLSVADTRGASRAFTVPVDSSLSEVTFSLSGGSFSRLTRPDGSPVLGTESGVSLVRLSTGVLVTVLHPAPGSWTVTTNSPGAWSLRILGEGAARFDRFDLVGLLGRSGHQGYFLLTGLVPVSGAIARARLSGDLVSTRFELRSQAGVLLQPAVLLPEPGGSPGEFFGPGVLSSQPFVVHALGLTRQGEPYQRVLNKAWVAP